jgi:hypothetical protein
MSDSHGHAGAPAHGSSHDHGHDFDPMPANELAPGEPHTPSWVPILGACLFLVGGTWFLVGQADDASNGGKHAHAHGEQPVAPAKLAPGNVALGKVAPREGGPSAPMPNDAEARRKLIEATLEKAKAAGVGPKQLNPALSVAPRPAAPPAAPAAVK